MMRRLLICLLTLLAASMSLRAQDADYSTFGLDDADAAAVKDIRRRMATIRRHRPTVALVLSGGGAKGAATVGALKFMEQYDLPIDMVVGTSVGGLLGGLYAMGYDVAYLDTLIHTIDWNMALSDKVDKQYIPYSRIRRKEKFMLSFPFYYKDQDYQDYMTGDMPFASDHNRQFHLGAGNEEDEPVENTLLGSLPSGFVFGQNVNHIISSRTVGYSDSTDFFKFPIPFACVATDMASGRAKVWHSGSINLAMRSTMSIPGLFAPVRTEGMVLVDGGMRNNFPVNIARQMGADIIIGIDLSEASLKANQIKNLADVVMSSMDLLSNDVFDQNVAAADIRIHPDMKGYNMLSFSKVAVDSMYARGYKAAQALAPEFEALKAKMGRYGRTLQALPAVDIGLTPVVIDGIDIVGVSEKEAEYLRSKMYVKPGSIVNRRVIEEDIATIFGKGGYDYVNYEFRGAKEPYRLRIICKKGPRNQMGFGARIDTEDLVSLLLNVGINTNALSGSSLDMTARISTNPYLNVHYAFNAPRFSTINVSAMLRYTDRNYFMSGNNYFNTRFLLATQEVYLSNMHWSLLDVKLGVRNQYFKVFRVLSNEGLTGYSLNDTNQDYPSTFIEGRLETLDDGYFPMRGVSAGLRTELVSRIFNRKTEDAPRWFAIFQADGLMPVSMGSRFALIPQGSFRYVLGQDIPIVFSNVMGGDMPGRYIEHQIPFIGINNAAFRRNGLVVARIDARLRFGQNHYVSVMGNAAYDFESFKTFEDGSLVGGVGLGYAYDTIVGPLKGQVFWSTLTRSVGVYFSLGFNF